VVIVRLRTIAASETDHETPDGAERNFRHSGSEQQ